MPTPTIYGPTNYAIYARNTVPKIVLTGYSDTITAELWLNGGVSPLFVGSYQSDFNDRVEIGFEGVYEDVLSSHLPPVWESDTQVNGLLEFVANIKQGNTNVASFNYYVANAVYMGGSLDFGSFVSSHFLTNQPVEKTTDAGAPEFLTYYDNAGDWTIKVRFYPKTGGFADYTLYTDTTSGVKTKKVDYNKVIRKASYLPSQLYGYYDIIAFNGKNVEVMRQRYILRERTGKEHYYLFVNALGGVDTFICQASCNLQPDITFNTGRFSDLLNPLDDTECLRQWQQSTGMMPWRYRDWLYELLTSKQEACRYHATIDYQENIVITGMDIAMSDDGQLASGSFTYMRADTVNAIHQAEYDNTLHASAANNAEEGEDLTVASVMEFAASQGGGYETEAVTVYSDHIYVTVGGTSTVYVIIDGQVEAEIDPASRMPVVVQVTSGDDVSFDCQDNPGTIAVNYYPDEAYWASQSATANQQTES